MLTRFDWLIEEAVRWGPVLPVAVLFAVALFEAVMLPWRLWIKAAWVLAVVLCGVAGVALLHRQEQTAHSQTAAQLAAETAALHGLWAQWDALSRTLPATADASPAAAFDSVDDAVAALSAKLVTLNEQIAALKAGSVGRSIDAATAAKLADNLRQYGSYRVVVSCEPGDVEAYSYANQLVGILKTAGWDANGPETTANVIDEPAMGVSVLVRDPTAPTAAKILLDAFGQFDIPHQSGISADNAIPDTATAELFVARKP